MRRGLVVALTFVLLADSCEQQGSRIAVKPGAGCTQKNMKGQDPDTGVNYVCGGIKRPYHWIQEG